MKAKKKNWIYVLLLCVTLSICMEAYPAKKKKETTDTRKERDRLELLIKTRDSLRLT